MDPLKIGIIGDYDGRPSHLATEEAIRHCSKKLGISCETTWIPTETLEDDIRNKLSSFDGLWCAPGSPYKSMKGALNGIKFARENNYPFIGTCGGFQHAVIEFARNVLKEAAVLDDNFNPYEPNKFITALSCSLIGQSRQISLDVSSKLYPVYGKNVIEEKYNCNFGVNSEFQLTMNQNGFKVIGTDENGESRIMIIEENTFFVATLFQPQLSSSYEKPHPLILEYLSAANRFHHS